MARDDGLQRALEQRQIESEAQPRGEGDVVEGAARLQLVEEPQAPLLRVRQRRGLPGIPPRDHARPADAACGQPQSLLQSRLLACAERVSHHCSGPSARSFRRPRRPVCRREAIPPHRGGELATTGRWKITPSGSSMPKRLPSAGARRVLASSEWPPEREEIVERRHVGDLEHLGVSVRDDLLGAALRGAVAIVRAASVVVSVRWLRVVWSVLPLGRWGSWSSSTRWAGTSWSGRRVRR